MSDDHFGAIVLSFLEGQASDEDAAVLNTELSRSADRRRMFVVLAKQHSLMGEMFAHRAPTESTGRISGSSSKVIPIASSSQQRPNIKKIPLRRPWSRVLIPAGIAATAALIVILTHPFGSGVEKPSEARLRIVEAHSAFILASGRRTPASANSSFAAGQGIATSGAEGSAEIEFPDGTHLWLGPNTEIPEIVEPGSTRSATGKHVSLTSGAISADVVKQPSGVPLIVSTPGMDAKIVGTKFNLSSASAQTRLDVIEGLVTLTRRNDHASIDVAAGEYTVADEHRPLVVNRLTTVAPRQPKIDFIQKVDSVPQQPVDSIEIAFPYELTAGDLNIVVVGWNDAAASVKSVTDNLGNKYTLAIGPSRGKLVSQSIYYAKNIVAGSAKVTVAFDQSAVFADIRMLEYSGLDKSNPFDGAHAGTGSGKEADSGRVSTTAPGLIFAAGTTTGGFSAPGMGFTQRILTAPDGDNAEDMIVTSRGSYGATATLAPEGEWLIQVVAFKAAGSQDWRTIGK
jgi:hypothetical protein